jgi:pimeloyl-ACP methyl ester carboxylesterase
MKSIYRSQAGREAVQQWCADQLASWPVPHESQTLPVNGVPTHLLVAGSGAQTVLFVPGTNFCAAAHLPLLTVLASRHRVVVADLPGQPGLSSGEHLPAGDRLAWYGSWLSAIIDGQAAGPMVVMGHSLGGAIAIAADSPNIAGLVLVAPGGLTNLKLQPSLLAAALGWKLLPRPATSARLLRAMHAPKHLPRKALIEWMTLIARHASSTGAPGLAKLPARSIRRLVVTGDHDVFLPPKHLERPVKDILGVELGVLPDAGHLVVDEDKHIEHLATLVTEILE